MGNRARHARRGRAANGIKRVVRRTVCTVRAVGRWVVTRAVPEIATHTAAGLLIERVIKK